MIGLEMFTVGRTIVDVLNGEGSTATSMVSLGHMHAEMARRTAGWPTIGELEASHPARAVTMPETRQQIYLLSVSSE